MGMGMSLRCEIFPDDLDATVRFYVDALGFAVVADQRGADQSYVGLERDGVRLGAAWRPPVAEPDVRRPPIGVELVLEVDDLGAARDQVARAGWPVDEDITQRPWGLADFRLLDPSGYYLRVTERAQG
jgi:catechol 2,3-dioxygenase-like lactoylglutathione lyase family enzyme